MSALIEITRDELTSACCRTWVHCHLFCKNKQKSRQSTQAANAGVKFMTRIVPTIFALLLVCGCNNDYRHQLPNGYSLTHFYSGSLAISDPTHKIVVGPSKYGIVVGVNNNFIVGNLDTEEKAFGVEEIPDKYFIVDTNSGAVAANLSLPEYQGRLNGLNLHEMPLKRPTKLDYK